MVFQLNFMRSVHYSGINYLFERRTPTEEIHPIIKDGRMLFSTAAIAHGAEYNIVVDPEGEFEFSLISRENERETLFEFVPVDISVDDCGLTEWHNAGASSQSNIRLFRIRDKNIYSQAMTCAYVKVLASL